jgi:hypothetical protein
VGSSQNVRAVSEADAGDAPESERRVGVHAALVSLLELAYGSRAAAVEVVERCLALGGQRRLPDDAPDVLAFVRANLVGILTADIGPRLTMALVDDFATRFGLQTSPQVSSAPPGSMPRPVARVSLRSRSAPAAAPEKRVVLVDADLVGRASLARALMRARWGVTVAESTEDFAEAFQGESPPTAVIVDANHPGAAQVLCALVALAPDMVAIVRGSDGAKALALLEACGVRRFDLRSREAPVEELLEAIQRSSEG